MNRGQEWSLRLFHELDAHEEASFLTLTYEVEPEGRCLMPKDLQDFIKRLREALKPRRFKYYAVGEYGDRNGRPHYHGIFFGVGIRDRSIINDCWGFGFVMLGSVTQQSINYVTSYVNKKLYGDRAECEYKGRTAPFARMSKGLGVGWLRANIDQILLHYGVFRNGKKVPVPRYYLKKLNYEFPSEMEDARFFKRLKDQNRLELSDEELIQLWRKDKERREQGEADLEALGKMRPKGNI